MNRSQFNFRKTFDRILKETVKQNDSNSIKGKAEVISALRNIQNKDETFASLTRNLSKLSKKGIRVHAEGGKIQFNGISIDMADFCNVKSNEVDVFLAGLPVKNDVTQSDVSSVMTVLNVKDINIPNIYELAQYITKFLSGYNSDIKEKIIEALSILIARIGKDVINELKSILPKNTVYYEIFQTVLKFFSQMAQELEVQYEQWQKTKLQKYYNPLFDNVDVNAAKRYIELMEKVVTFCFEMQHMTSYAIKKMVTFTLNWVVNKVEEYQNENERKKNRTTYSAKAGFRTYRQTCNVCGGYYFQKFS